jgi:hypothetical protein
MDIALIYNGPKYTTGTYWKTNLKAMGHRVQHFKKYRLKKKTFDLLIRIDDGYETSSEFLDVQGIKVLIATDTHNDAGKRLMRIAQPFDHIFFPQKQGIETFLSNGFDKNVLHYLPNAGDERIHQRYITPKKYDTAMIGGNYRSVLDGFSRAEFFDMVIKTYPNSYLGKCDFRKMSKVYSSARIGLNVACGDVNMRNFEITASGTMLLTEEVNEIEDFSELYADGKECVVFEKRNWKDMFEKTEYYLAHDNERESIAEKGHQKFIQYHTYRHRIAALLNIIAVEGHVKR